MKVAINRCFGGFGLSDKAYERLIELGWTVTEDWNDKECDIHREVKEESFGGRYYPLKFDQSDIEFRTNLDVIKVIEEFGAEASSSLGQVVIREIPDGIDFKIDDYDGVESIHEVHRSW